MADPQSGTDATLSRADVAAAAKGATPGAAGLPGGEPAAGAEPSVGPAPVVVSEPQPYTADSAPTTTVTLTQHWTDPSSGRNLLPGTVVTVDAEVAAQLRTAAWALPAADEPPVTAGAVPPPA